ncbi:thiamine phosphate synthase [Corynebacterium renale]|uniref:Thiamine-phosphate synthase n=1 Tax=Corynebacterium renale TaxID=1724 RepID=A0A2A9DNT9_9CORY|nr:thiamine phosphate synthase [Corynebacterium renale]PFG28263.1 thiamine-phosphate pyrophosphorylase/hydroxymethylpyrimidine kinase/phosphomethylpyrimidine kinase/thiamine-phosphate diphosphorylase [Corynebacterium renale]SQI19478.1 multifunctional thiamine-phosphate pyrophosphorylase/synthase/phosphomethylpyrimidine kinase [Corynebacterium renale]
MAVDYTCYLITDPDLAGGRERVVDVVEQAVAGGVTVVQLRDKTAPDEAIEAQAREILRRVDVPLIINDRVEVAARLGVGVHVGQGDMPLDQVRNLVGPNVPIGLSVGNMAELATITDVIPDVIGIGPVWDTATKKDAPAGIGVAGLQDVANAAHERGIASVAIGGVNQGNVAKLAGTGVAGFCVVSAIMAAPDPARAAAELRAAFEGA